MSEVTPRHYLYGLILLAFVLMGGMALITELGVHQQTLLDDDRYSEFSIAINTMNRSLISSVDELESDTGQDQTEPGVFGWLNSLIGTSWTILTDLYNTFKFGGAAFTALGQVFGLPGWIVSTLLTFVTLIIAFSIISAIFQKNV